MAKAFYDRHASGNAHASFRASDHRWSKRKEALAYSKKALAFTGMLLVTLTSAGVGSIVLVRRAKAEYQRQSIENMQALIQGTIEDHKSKSGDKDEPSV